MPIHPLAQPLSVAVPPGACCAWRETATSTGFCAELAEEIDRRTFAIDRRVHGHRDWPHQVLVEASRLKAQMLLLGASERSLAHRVFHGQALERILRETPCDVGIYRGP